MGVWGDGLYSGDFAADLRSAIAAISRLPFDPDRLLELLCEIEPQAARDPTDSDYSAFWLVSADQFHKRGIRSATLMERAIEIIDSGTDIEIQKSLGMADRNLARRRSMLQKLRAQLTGPTQESAPRRTLKKPQALVMKTGEVLAYPTSRGKCINSYYSSKEKIPGWQQDSWSIAVIVDHGLLFDYLAWYRPMTIFAALENVPSVSEISLISPWVLRRPGTCSQVHFRRLELQKIGAAHVSAHKLRSTFGELKPGRYQAINDISIANELSVAAQGKVFGAVSAAFINIRVEIADTLSSVCEELRPV